jgi:trimeric autotransporter adhesin
MNLHLRTKPYGKNVLIIGVFFCLPFLSFAQNDLCGNAIALTSNATCVNTAGTLVGATYTGSSIGTIDCGVANRNDVWYTFVAQRTNPTITLTTALANPRLQLFSGACGSLVSLACGNNTLSASGLTIGALYYVRVYTDPNVSGTFNICIVDPPINDLVCGATVLISDDACVNVAGTLTGSSYTAIGTIGCGVATRNDVWYKFVAKSTNPTITISSAPANPRLQLFSGSCGSIAPVACGNTSIAATGLTLNATYYIRVYTDPNATGAFNICVTDPAPANNLICNAITLTPSANCTSTQGTLAGSTYTNSSGCANINRNDVWYRFTATSSNPSVRVTSSSVRELRLQIYSNACAAGLASVACGNGVINATGLTIGAVYFIRVYTDPNDYGIFDICVVNVTNDDCTGALPLTPSTVCNNITGNFFLATPSAQAVAPCTGPVVYDLWYYFQATATTASVQMSGVGVNINTPRVQVFSGSCGSMTSISCGTPTTAALTGLTVGEYYFVRVYASAGSAPAGTAGAGFSLCVTVPVSTAPANDNCAGAITILQNLTCHKTMGTLAGATVSAPAVSAGCNGPATADVWYRFVATSTSANVAIGDFGAQFTGTRRMQVMQGACPGGLTSLACGTSAATLTVTGLTIGNTYHVRVYSSTLTPTYAGDFSVCISTPAAAQRSGNSYVNITKRTTGGVVEPGDILEIRMTVNHTSGTLTNMRYVDDIPTNTSLIQGPNAFTIISNEGIVVQRFSSALGDDAANYDPAPGATEYDIRMNLGFSTTLTPQPNPGTPPNNTETEFASAVGTLATNHIPRGASGALFAIAYRVQVTGAVNSTISLTGGRFTYRNGGGDITLTGTPYQILVSSPMNLCVNSTGLNMSQEFGGTFGTGTTLNRSTDLDFPIPGYTYVYASATQSVNDGQYAIVKNMSPRSGIDRNAERQPGNSVPMPFQNSQTYRMHGGHWDIDGDHTGTNDGIGNIPQHDGVNAGYMLMVNADYVASETYRQTLTDLCPNTYYEFSAWFRNICPTCGYNYLDNTAYSPRQSGVRPNLTFALDGLDRYNTGEIDSASGWVKKGFVFITGPAQTTAVFSIRNNSQGGGGNDWVMDDITVATCLPSMSYSPSLVPTICSGTYITIRDTIRSFFSNYVNYKWQRSEDNGFSYTDIAGTTGTGTTTFVNGNYEYVSTYTVPPSFSSVSNSGDLYRVIVATTGDNLADPVCNVTDGISIINLSVIDCGAPLKLDLLSFNGILINDYAELTWTTSREDESVTYRIERSYDGSNFSEIGTVKGYNNNSSLNKYSFTDPTLVSGKNYYRVYAINAGNNKKYTRVIPLSKRALPNFALTNVINPFNQLLEFDITTTSAVRINVELLDMFGKPVKSKSYMAQVGVNVFNLSDTESLPAGTYILRVRTDTQVVSRKVLKRTR